MKLKWNQIMLTENCFFGKLCDFFRNPDIRKIHRLKLQLAAQSLHDLLLVCES